MATLTEPNVYSDGGGLYLRVRPAGRSWFFIGTFQGKRIELGLGSALDVTLAKARERAAEIRTMLIDGIDPRVERAKAKVQKRPAETFGTFATTLVDDIEEGFKNAKHRQQWRNTLRPAIAARALEFTILTAARSGEARGMTWTEVDLEQEIWTVPASRMKAEVVHQVPLSDAAMAILAEMKEDDSSQGGRKTSAWNSQVKAGRERARPSA